MVAVFFFCALSGENSSDWRWTHSLRITRIDQVFSICQSHLLKNYNRLQTCISQITATKIAWSYSLPTSANCGKSASEIEWILPESDLEIHPKLHPKIEASLRISDGTLKTKRATDSVFRRVLLDLPSLVQWFEIPCFLGWRWCFLCKINESKGYCARKVPGNLSAFWGDCFQGQWGLRTA